jgi:hypothetical protein
MPGFVGLRFPPLPSAQSVLTVTRQEGRMAISWKHEQVTVQVTVIAGGIAIAGR